ncbi:MAG TPA: hypothetical protein VE871_15785 [Longimicrobium sp.]|nr:hypothetical protein [Longimicrobium sp.]
MSDERMDVVVAGAGVAGLAVDFIWEGLEGLVGAPGRARRQTCRLISADPHGNPPTPDPPAKAGITFLVPRFQSPGTGPGRAAAIIPCIPRRCRLSPVTRPL